MISVSCKGQNDDGEKVHISHKSEKNTYIEKNKNVSRDKSIGVFSLREGYRDTKIILYNQDGSIWKLFVVTDNFKDNKIKPFALKADDRLLVFQAFDSTDSFNKVKVDENKNLYKFIKKSDKTFVFESWEKHILKVFSVDFDYKTNPPKEEPSDNSKDKTYNREQFYHPIKVKDEWLMIKDDDDNESWIKWKDKTGDLILLLYYSA
jgi:hypothetical protein